MVLAGRLLRTACLCEKPNMAPFLPATFLPRCTRPSGQRTMPPSCNYILIDSSEFRLVLKKLKTGRAERGERGKQEKRAGTAFQHQQLIHHPSQEERKEWEGRHYGQTMIFNLSIRPKPAYLRNRDRNMPCGKLFSSSSILKSSPGPAFLCPRKSSKIIGNSPKTHTWKRDGTSGNPPWGFPTQHSTEKT